ncbi:MAG: high-affinity zinc transporter periplasmic component [Candidatus Hydrogenedentes bacterium ADurb.Bin101]|nr:MAG: high-affinity zinc transporter periplasmic component [Candidatus Hydrogenedentes bacterium ADurb.Bin101]HOC67855.1 zinc ABC transporter substrate-binding protein [Candidatus Hydrogenedentota bacterium]
MTFLRKHTGDLRYLLYGLLVIVALSGCSEKHSPIAGAEIIAGTTLITDIVKDISDLKVEAYTLLPSTSCPSQFDMKPHDITQLQQAELVLLHGWQLNLANIRRTLEAAQVPENKRRIIDVTGNWMVPEVQKEAVEKTRDILAEYAPQSASLFRERAAVRVASIEAAGAAAREALPPETAAGITVFCHEMQAPFLKWAGYAVVGTFNRPEDWSVADAEAMVKKGQEHPVGLVVDNLQSGGLAMSMTLAGDIGAAYVVLSNFPGGFPDTPTWQAAFEENIRRLRKATVEAPVP